MHKMKQALIKIINAYDLTLERIIDNNKILKELQFIAAAIECARDLLITKETMNNPEVSDIDKILAHDKHDDYTD